MRRVIYTLLGWGIFAVAAFLIYLRYGFVASEGYPTWEAVRNYLVRNGEVVIRLPRGVTALSASCDDSSSEVRILGQTVIVKIGYSWCCISIQAEVNGHPETIAFYPQKLNNWNRILYVPANPEDPRSDFWKFENGVEKRHSDVARNAASEQDKRRRQ